MSRYINSLEALVVCPNIHLGGGFRGRVWIRRRQSMCFVHKFGVRVAIDFVGTNVDESLDLLLVWKVPDSIEQALCGHNVVERETSRILK